MIVGAAWPWLATASVTEALSRAMSAPVLPVRLPAPTDVERSIALVAYQQRAQAPLWFSSDPPHRALPRAREALALMLAAASKGLDETDYAVDWLASRLQHPEPEEEAMRLDVVFSIMFIRYLSDLGFGRIDPARLGYDLPQQRRRGSLHGAVLAALVDDRPAMAAESIEPRLPIYRRLLVALERHRRMALAEPPPALTPVRGSIKPGDPYEGMASLRAHLQHQGDLSASAAGTGERYDASAVEAVMRFQARHGLPAQGLLGAATIDALRVPAERRVRQIELSLERLRWLGELPAGRFVAINIPEFRLWAITPGNPSMQVLSMRVIVGASVTGTPVFVDSIEAVEFNPYWNVPTSIASRELYPRLVRDPGYLAREEMELLGTPGRTGAELQRALASGSVRIRQKPGAKNALGKVKFVMPNRHSVYLHDTPSRQLFERTQRAFSHGCIRLERPFDLVALALADRAEWTQDKVMEVVAAGNNLVVRLQRPIPVLIFYSTVNVDETGQVRFLPDLYRLDARLESALNAR